MKKLFIAVIYFSIAISLKAQPLDLGFRLESQVLFNKTSRNENDSETSSLLTCGELTLGIYRVQALGSCRD